MQGLSEDAAALQGHVHLGTDHAKKFVVEVVACVRGCSAGRRQQQKMAEQRAAREALSTVEQNPKHAPGRRLRRATATTTRTVASSYVAWTTAALTEVKQPEALRASCR